VIQRTAIRQALSVLRQPPRTRDYDRRVEANFGDGTNLAPGRLVATTGFHVVRAAESRATATEWVRIRPFRIAPTIVVIIGLLLAAKYPTPRIAVVGVAYGLSFVYQLIEAARARRTGVDERSLFLSHLVLLALHAVIIGATGGMHSPLWPGLLGNSLGTLNIFGKSRESTITILYTCALTLILAVLPQSFEGPAIAAPFHTALAAWAILFTLFLLRTSSFALGDAFRRTEATLDRMREDVIAAATERRLGEVEVTIAAGGEDEDARIEIRDTGKGMSTEDLARVGTPFFTTREGGTGLGVVLARAVIEQHGGAVVYTSDAGRGTRVLVRLPAKPASSPPGDLPLAAPEREVHAHG